MLYINSQSVESEVSKSSFMAPCSMSGGASIGDDAGKSFVISATISVSSSLFSGVFDWDYGTSLFVSVSFVTFL